MPPGLSLYPLSTVVTVLYPACILKIGASETMRKIKNFGEFLSYFIVAMQIPITYSVTM